MMCVVSRIALFGGMLLAVTAAPLSASSVLVDWQVPAEDDRFTARGFSPIPGVQSELLYDVTQATDGIYNHHPAISTVDDALVVTWSNHLEGYADGGEEGPGQKVMFRVTSDGQTWTAPTDLFPSLGDHGAAFDAGRVVTANGFARVGNDLYAIAEVADNEAKNPGETRIRTGLGRLARRVHADGSTGDIFWLDGDPVEALPGYPQFADPQSNPALAPTATAIRDYLAQPLNQPAWDFVAQTAGEEPTADGERMVEPSTYQRPDGSLVRLFRDIGNRGFLYASESTDGGGTWTPLTQTNIPDSPSKTVSGTLPDGRTYIIGNQVNGQQYGRDPLTLAISRDGVNFDWAAAIRFDRPPIEFPGDGKGAGFQYPSATIVDGELVVTYTIGKEDVAVSRFAVPQFADRANGTQLLVASSRSDRITRFDGPTGRFVEHLPDPESGNPMDNPVAMAAGPDGMVYVVSRGNDRVLRYHPVSGELVDVFVDGQGLDAPTGLAFAANGDLLVSNRNGGVRRFAGPQAPDAGAAKGTFIDVGDGGLDGPFNMALGPDGGLYVASFDTDQVLRYDGQSGDFVDVFAQDQALSRPQGLLFDDEGNLLVASTGSNDVLRFTPEGDLLDTFIEGDGLLNSPNDLAFGPDGHLYVSSRLDQQVLRFDGETGNFLDVFAWGAAMQGTTGIVFTAIPEPGTAALVGLGAVLLLKRRR